MSRGEKIQELRSLLEARIARDRMFFEHRDELTLDEVPFWVVDVETTGDRDNDRIIEIAAIKVKQGEMQRVINTLVNPGRPISRFAHDLTGINDRMLSGAPSPKEVYPWLFSLLKNGVFVAHRVNFDLRYVDMESARLKLPELNLPTLCTVRLSKRLVHDLSGYSLDHLASYFGLEFGMASSPSSRHRALGDAWVCARAFISLLELAKKVGVRNFGEIKELESMPIRKAKNLWRV
jgi:DNA polymerase III epsilon subunit family exonuclease